MKMITAWGSSGSGKSTFSLALATALAKHRQNVVIVSLDMKTPALPVYLPKLQLGTNNSIGTLLSADKVDYDGLRSKIHIHPQSERIGISGLVSGENPISCKLFEREKIIDFLRVLDSSPFSYTIFDCDSNTFFDVLTLLALEISDHVFRLITPDVKGYEFEKSAMLWMKNSENFTISKHIKVASMVHTTSAEKQFAELSGNVSYVLPFALEVHNRFSAGELIDGCHDRVSQRYEAEIDRIVQEILSHE